MPNVLPIPKLLRKGKALIFLFSVKVSCLLQVKIQILKDEWWSNNTNCYFFLIKKVFKIPQWLFFLVLLSAKGSVEICKKWWLAVSITGQLAFHRLELDRADSPRICLFSSWHFKVGLWHLFLTCLFLIPFIFTYIPSFRRKVKQESRLQLQNTSKIVDLLIWLKMDQ